MSDKLFSDNELESIYHEPKDIKVQKKVRFKKYDIGENYLFPSTTDEYISKNHIARLISILVDKLDIAFIIETYKGGGASSYNPRMMLKVWLLGFVYKIYTSRPLETAVEENLPFIWISAGQTPDFRSLNNFRIRLKGEIKKIFKQIVLLGMQLGIIEGKDVFIDHTKIEADANKHKIVWRKQVEKQMQKIDEELDELFKHIDKLNADEDKRYGDSRIKDTEINSFDIEDIDKMITSLNDEIKTKRKAGEDTEEIKESKKKLRRTKELFLRKTSYNLKKEALGDRNSFSKTDPDATAMMQKDKLNIKPSYNEGIAVENGFVLNYEQSNKSADNVSFKDVVNGTIDNICKKIENVHTDGAYGNEENSEYLEEKEINNYMKFNTYRKEKSKKWHREKVRKEDFKYIQEYDCYICPNGAKLLFEEYKETITATGYKIKLKIYKAEIGRCSSCPYKKYCTTSDKRSIQISEKYEKHKKMMRENLGSEKGKELRKRRGFEVESVFGDRKHNKKYRRFVLRGKDEVKIESGLYYTVHNIRKIYKHILNEWTKQFFNFKTMQLSEI